MTSTEAPPQAAGSLWQQMMASASRDGWNVQPAFNNTQVHDGGDGQFGQYKVDYRKPELDTIDESQFYLDTENVEFVCTDGSDDQRLYKQLEVLYRARGREIEELTRKMEASDEENSREVRILKHRLALASGEVESVNENLRQCQQLLQHSKSDTYEACSKIRALEAIVLSLHDTIKEVIVSGNGQFGQDKVHYRKPDLDTIDKSQVYLDTENVEFLHTDTQQWISERSAYELKISRINYELSEYKQKLDLAVSEKLMFQKHAEDLKLDYQNKMKTLIEKHKEISDVVKYDRQMQEFEEKLAEMYKQSSALIINHGTEANIVQSFQESNLPSKLHILEKIMKEKDAKLRELEKIIQEQKEVVLKTVSTNHNHVADSEGSVTDFECCHGDLSESSPEKLRECIKKIESVLHTTKQKCNREVSELKQQHKKESEISVILREEKFQVELRYFLKEKEDHWKTRMETTVRQHEQALKQADEKHKCVLQETICEYEHKYAELQKIIDEYNKIRPDKEMKQVESTSVGDIFSLRDRMKHEIVLLEEKYTTEKARLERKMKQIEEEKVDEIVNLCLCQEEDARKLKETFDAALSSLPAEHHNIIRQLKQELSLQKSEVDNVRELAESLKKENECAKLVVEQLQKEVVRMKVSSSHKQIKEQREKWFLEAQEYLNTEIKQVVDDQIKKEEGKMRERLEKLNGAEERMRKQLEEMNKEGEKVRRELEKMNEEGVKMRNKLDKIKTEEERTKKEQENIQERQRYKEQFDNETKEEARKIAQIEVDKLNKKFVVELNARVKAIQTQVEQQKMTWQEEERQKLLEERETIIKALYLYMQWSLQDTKSRLEMKMEEVKDNALREMQEDVRKQVQSMQEEWKWERSHHNNRTKDELDRLKECYQAEDDAKLKVPHSGSRNVTSLKSQDHHLSTGASIPGEELAHPCSTSLPTPMPVVGPEVIEMFKVHTKADIRSVLSQKVPECTRKVSALEYSLGDLSEHVKSLIAKLPGPAWSRPDSGSYNSPRQQLADDDEVVVGGKQTSCQHSSEAFIKNMPVLDQHLHPYHHMYHSNYEKSLEQQKSHPQLDQMDVFDSDRYQHPSATVNNSSPAGHTYARS